LSDHLLSGRGSDARERPEGCFADVTAGAGRTRRRNNRRTDFRTAHADCAASDDRAGNALSSAHRDTAAAQDASTEVLLGIQGNVAGGDEQTFDVPASG